VAAPPAEESQDRLRNDEDRARLLHHDADDERRDHDHRGVAEDLAEALDDEVPHASGRQPRGEADGQRSEEEHEERLDLELGGEYDDRCYASREDY